MEHRTSDQVVHAYDVARRQVLCGTQHASSTKHASGVTCRTCRELLDRPQGARPATGAPAADGE